MPLNDYYEPFYMQSWMSRPDGFGGLVWEWGDGLELEGLYRQDASSEMRIAEAQGTSSGGTFITNIDMEVKEGDVIRRARDHLYLRITSIPVKSPSPAVSKFQTMNAEKTIKPT